MVEIAPGTSSEVLAFAATRLDRDSDEYWLIVHELQRRGDRETFEVAERLANSPSSDGRALALDLLGQLGFWEGRPFLEESLPIAMAAAHDPDTGVKIAAILALGNLGDARALPVVLASRTHQQQDVRWAVAVVLPAIAGDPPADQAARALVELTSDPDSDVRDWATFGLGSQLDVGSTEVRDALAARLDDPEGDTAGEALLGLARRQDPRATSHVLRRLEKPDCGNLIVEAAAALGSPLFLPNLLRLKHLGWSLGDPRGEWLERAIEACLAGQQSVNPPPVSP